MEWTDGEYRISNDKSLILIEDVCKLLANTYWANKRPREVIEKSIENSICYGIYNENKQVGYGRIITDYATTYYIADVILNEKHRGRGLGKKLVECMVEFDGISGGLGMLLTRDAHGLYTQYGFERDGEKFMARRV